jgi:IS30 family transposase
MESQTRHGHDTEELKLQQAADKLKQLPRKERSLRAQVEYLRAFILESLEKGYSYGEVATVLAEQDIHISVSTLRQYIHPAKHEELAEVEPESIVAPPADKASKKRFVQMPKEL